MAEMRLYFRRFCVRIKVINNNKEEDCYENSSD